jgi:acylphosphatase
MTDPIQRLEATVRGRVQGVGFRWFVVREAHGLDLVGWVANTSDGSVRVVAEGPAPALDRLVGLLHQGPPGAVVDSVDVNSSPARGGERRFHVRASGHTGD